MIRGYLAKAVVCLVIGFAGSGCASTSSPYAVASNSPNYSSNGCPDGSAAYCDRRQASKCRCISDRAVRDFMRQF